MKEKTPTVMTTSWIEGHDGPHGVLEVQDPEEEEGQREACTDQDRRRGVQEGDQIDETEEDGHHDPAAHPFGFKPPGDVDAHQQESVKDGVQSLVLQVFSHLGAHRIHLPDFSREPRSGGEGRGDEIAFGVDVTARFVPCG